jgi:hypothetical protein
MICEYPIHFSKKGTGYFFQKKEDYFGVRSCFLPLLIQTQLKKQSLAPLMQIKAKNKT